MPWKLIWVRKWDWKRKKYRRCSNCRDRQSKIKLNRYRETDQYPSWLETSVALQSRRRTCQLLSDTVSYCQTMERKFFWLTTRSIKRMALDRAIKMVLPVHCQYNKEEQAGSVCVTLCAPSSTDVAQTLCYFSSKRKGILENKSRKIFWHIWASAVAD